MCLTLQGNKYISSCSTNESAFVLKNISRLAQFNISYIIFELKQFERIFGHLHNTMKQVNGVNIYDIDMKNNCTLNLFRPTYTTGLAKTFLTRKILLFIVYVLYYLKNYRTSAEL